MTNSADPDQRAPLPDLGLHCLHRSNLSVSHTQRVKDTSQIKQKNKKCEKIDKKTVIYDFRFFVLFNL